LAGTSAAHSDETEPAILNFTDITNIKPVCFSVGGRATSAGKWLGKLSGLRYFSSHKDVSE
jgi:hypothetical protein